MTALTYSCIAPLVLGFAALGFLLLYVAFRYNMIYALDVTLINTQGQSYAKAMNQLTTGVYLLEVCLIGLFAISSASSKVAIGCLVLMVIFLVFTIVFHVFLNRAIAGLQKSVSHDGGPMAGDQVGDAQELHSVNDKGHTSSRLPGASTRPRPSNFLVRLLRPPPLPAFDAFLSTNGPEVEPEDRLRAYVDPAISSPKPLIWIARDPLGISQREVAETNKFVPCTDEGAWFDEKSGKLMTAWVAEPEVPGSDHARKAPIWEKQMLY